MRTEGTSTGGGHGPIVSKVEKPEPQLQLCSSISGLVVEYIVAIDVTRVRFPADALLSFTFELRCNSFRDKKWTECILNSKKYAHERT